MVVSPLVRLVLGDPNDRALRRLREPLRAIAALEARLQSLDDAALAATTDALRARLDEGLDALLPEAFAAVREAARRELGERMYDEQLTGAVALHRGLAVEMATGEGKTLAAVAPAYLNALVGRPVFVITVNDYLARRDAAWMGPVYARLGMRAGAIVSSMPDDERRAAYACDVVYGTNTEFGFDALRDNMRTRADRQLQRDRYFAIVDEVDSALIDEARRPLVLSGVPRQNAELYEGAHAIAVQLEPRKHFEVKLKEQSARMTDRGIVRAQQLAGVPSFYDGEQSAWPHAIEQALRALHVMQRDVHYVVRDLGEGERVVAVDEFTGRLVPNRHFGGGLHQALQVKEGLVVDHELQTLAQTTFQHYFLSYEKLAGMSGTAVTEAEELRKIYGLDVVAIPTHAPVIRRDEGDVVFRTEREKWNAVAEDVAALHERGQPVLVGTTSIENSERLGALLQERGVPHEVLNAKHDAREAQIIAQAGRCGAVTVSTNMAGRGTDIALGGNVDALYEARRAAQPEVDPEALRAECEAEVARERARVVALGGLRVVGTERHDAKRLDNQLRGRAGRQGDPGSTVFYVSLEDRLMKLFTSSKVITLMDRLGAPEGVRITSRSMRVSVERSQRALERRNFDIRKALFEYDRVLDGQRRVIYGRRQEILDATDARDHTLAMARDTLERLIVECTVVRGRTAPRRVDATVLAERLNAQFGVDVDAAAALGECLPAEALEAAEALVRARYDAHRAAFGDTARWCETERLVLLNTIDVRWKDHLQYMGELQSGIGLRGFFRIDPKVEYRRDSFEAFGLLLAGIADDATRVLFRLEAAAFDERLGVKAEAASTPASAAPEGPDGSDVLRARDAAGAPSPRRRASATD